MRLEVVDVVEAVSRLVNKGYDREYRIKDGHLFDLALNSTLDPRDIHVDTALRLESGSDAGDASNVYAISDQKTHNKGLLIDAFDIVDEIDCGDHDLRLAFHLGPFVEADLDGHKATLRWPDAPEPGAARLELPDCLHWTLHRGETEPIMGWYSDGLGRRTPAVTLVGSGRTVPEMPLCTRLEFIEAGNAANFPG